MFRHDETGSTKTSLTCRTDFGTVGIAAALTLTFSDMAFAADGATDFSTVYERLHAWATGSLGKALALAFLLVGLAVGLLRGNLSSAVTAAGAALALVTLPSIINAIFTV